jgi:uncharacterized membrane protein
MGETTTNILIGLLCIILGIFIIILFSSEKNKRSLFSIKFQTAGIILIMIGIGLIVRATRK